MNTDRPKFKFEIEWHVKEWFVDYSTVEGDYYAWKDLSLGFVTLSLGTRVNE